MDKAPGSHFEDEQTAASDLTKENHTKAQEVMAKGTDTPPRTAAMLAHNLIIGALEFPSSSTDEVRNLAEDFEEVEIK